MFVSCMHFRPEKQRGASATQLHGCSERAEAHQARDLARHSQGPCRVANPERPVADPEPQTDGPRETWPSGIAHPREGRAVPRGREGIAHAARGHALEEADCGAISEAYIRMDSASDPLLGDEAVFDFSV